MLQKVTPILSGLGIADFYRARKGFRKGRSRAGMLGCRLIVGCLKVPSVELQLFLGAAPGQAPFRVITFLILLLYEVLFVRGF